MFLLLDDICASSHATTEKVDKSYLHVRICVEETIDFEDDGLSF